MPEITTIISAGAAVVSAIGGTFACIAAFRSSGHAKEAFEESKKAEKRISLKQLSLTAHQVIVEAERVKWLSQKLKYAYRDLAAFSGNSGSSRLQLALQEVESKEKMAVAISEKAQPFVEINTTLLSGTLDEITGREVKISQCLVQLQAIREKLEIELSEIQAQNTTYREVTLSSKG